MANPCIIEGCENPIFSHKHCKSHQHKRTDDKWIKAIQKRRYPGIKPKKKSIPVPKPYSGVDDLNVGGELKMFEHIWDTREHISFLSDKPLGVVKNGHMWVNVFAHVLAKGLAKYPKFKLYSKNVILLTPEEHNLLDFCSEAQRQAYAAVNGCDWQKVYDFREELKEEYKLLD
jgi:hypothetical protein